MGTDLRPIVWTWPGVTVVEVGRTVRVAQHIARHFVRTCGVVVVSAGDGVVVRCLVPLVLAGNIPLSPRVPANAAADSSSVAIQSVRAAFRGGGILQSGRLAVAEPVSEPQ